LPTLPDPLSFPFRNRHQNNLPPSAPHTLAIYGHDAKAGLQVNPEVDISPYDPSSPNHHNHEKENKKNKKHKHKDKKKKKGLRYAFGLDSGCGHERQLTALIISAGPAGVEHRIEQVDCSPNTNTENDTDTRSASNNEDPGQAEEREERQRPVGLG
jgi:hypothetical protein